MRSALQQRWRNVNHTWNLNSIGDSKLGIWIQNDCVKGSTMDTGSVWCEVVSGKYLGARKVSEPAWLGFKRVGPKEEYDIGHEINRAARILPRAMRERLG
jgi:hypothetical protein